MHIPPLSPCRINPKIKHHRASGAAGPAFVTSDLANNSWVCPLHRDEHNARADSLEQPKRGKSAIFRRLRGTSLLTCFFLWVSVVNFPIWEIFILAFALTSNKHTHTGGGGHHCDNIVTIMPRRRHKNRLPSVCPHELGPPGTETFRGIHPYTWSDGLGSDDEWRNAV